MSTQMNTKEMEKKLIWSYNKDGLIDIGVGAVLLSFGLLLITDNVALAGISPAVIVPFLIAAKDKITYPRLGFVKFSNRQKSKWKAFFLITLISGIVFFFLLAGQFASENLQDLLRQNFMFIFGAIVAVGLFFAGLQIGGRFNGYAVLTLAIFWGGEWLNLEPPVYITVLGTLITLSGILMLIQFVREYPLPDREDMADERYQ